MSSATFIAKLLAERREEVSRGGASVLVWRNGRFVEKVMVDKGIYRYLDGHHDCEFELMTDEEVRKIC